MWALAGGTFNVVASVVNHLPLPLAVELITTFHTPDVCNGASESPQFGQFRTMLLGPGGGPPLLLPNYQMVDVKGKAHEIPLTATSQPWCWLTLSVVSLTDLGILNVPLATQTLAIPVGPAIPLGEMNVYGACNSAEGVEQIAPAIKGWTAYMVDDRAVIGGIGLATYQDGTVCDWGNKGHFQIFLDGPGLGSDGAYGRVQLGAHHDVESAVKEPVLGIYTDVRNEGRFYLSFLGEIEECDAAFFCSVEETRITTVVVNVVDSGVGLPGISSGGRSAHYVDGLGTVPNGVDLDVSGLPITPVLPESL